ERDDVDLRGKALERRFVVVGRDGLVGGNARRGAVLFRRADVAVEAQARGGERQHAAELAAAEDADRSAGREHAYARGSSPTSAVCLARNMASRSASTGSLSARIEAASSAALAAPASPMASVPTGTPFGICTMDRRLSMPLSAALFTGTPSTGSGVIDA